METDRLILVTGAARSGVSIIGGVLHLCGARVGRVPRVTRYDGRGSFENADVRDAVVKPFLRGIGADPTGQYPLPSIERCLALADTIAPTWRRRVEMVFQEQGVTTGVPFYASAQSCLLWPVWHRAFPDARWVLVRRRDEDVVRSCMKTGYMNAFRDESGWRRWMNAHKERFEEMVDAGLGLWQIWPQRMLGGKLAELRNLVVALDLKWDQTMVEDFIAPILWKSGVFEVAD